MRMGVGVDAYDVCVCVWGWGSCYNQKKIFVYLCCHGEPDSDSSPSV